MRKNILSGIFGLMMFCILFVMPGSMKKVLADEVDVFQVIFPANTDHVFDFIMDPQELICRTDAEAYGGLTFEEGSTLFFRRHDGGVQEDYSSSSDALVITNAGTADVDIVVSASISSGSMEKIIMTDDSMFAEDTNASLYLALTDGTYTVPILAGEDAVIQMTLPGLKEDGTREEYRFWLVGAVNKNGDWSEAQEEDPRVTVTWSAAAVENGEPETDEIMEENEAAESEVEEEETGEEMSGEETEKGMPDMPEEEEAVTDTETLSLDETEESEQPEVTGDKSVLNPEMANEIAEYIDNRVLSESK